MEQLFNLIVARAHEIAPHLIHAAWLGVAVIVLPALFLRFSRWGNAATRYVLCWGLLLAVIALPAMIGIAGQVSEIIASRQTEQPAVYTPSHTADASTLPQYQAATGDASTLNKQRARAVSPTFVGAGPVVTPLTPKAGPVADPPPTPPIEPASFDFSLLLGLVPGLLLGLCLLIAGILIVRVVLSLVYLAYTILRSAPASQHLQDRAAYWADRLDCPRAVSVRISRTLRSPAATGYFKGIVLLPAEMLDDFAPCDIDAVMIHELSHLKRFDDWARLAEHLFAAFFFYLPAVHWLIREIDLHREIACDDMVVATTGRPAEYARTLTRLAEFAAPNPRAALAPGAMITKKQIFARFSMILSAGRKRDNRLASRALTTVFVTLIAALLFVGPKLPALTLPGSAVTFSDVSEAIFGNEEDPVEETTPAEADTAREAEEENEATSDEQVTWEASAPQPEMRIRNRVVNRNRVHSAPVSVNPVGLSAEDIEGLATLAAASADLGDLAYEAGPITEAVEGAVRGLENSLRGLSSWEGTVSDIDEDGDRGYFEYRDGRFSMRMEWDGELTFTDDFLGIEGIEPGGYFEIEGRDRRDRMRVLIESDNSGKLDHLVYRDGRSAEWDDEAKEWFADALETMIRVSGLGAEQRVAMIREKDGIAGVLDEIEEIPASHARAYYYAALMDGKPLSDDERTDVFRHAGRWLDSDYNMAEFLIGAAENDQITPEMMPDIVRAMDEMDSNYEIRRVLTAIGVGSTDDPEVLIEVLRIAQRMDSDYERAELLIDVAPSIRGDAALMDAYVEAVTDIDSDYETRRVLQALGLERDVDPKLASRIMPIVHNMDSDYEKVELLIELAMAAENDEELIAMYVDVASSIDSDYEMRRALQQVSYLSSANDSTLLKLLYLAKDLNSDYERAEFLREMAELTHRSNEMRAAYLEAALGISSDYEKVRVLEDMVESGSGDKEFLGEMLKVVEFIHSDFEKAKLLRQMSPLCAMYPDLEDSFVDAIESIHGDYERDKLYRTFYRDLKQLQ